MKYRRKPIIVDAVVFDPKKKPWPEGIQEIFPNWAGMAGDDGIRRFNFISKAQSSINRTGVQPIQLGDRIVTNPDGARYVVTMFDFFDFYESVTEKELANG